MRIDLLSLVGYDSVVTRQLAAGDVTHLAWSTTLSLVGALLFASGGAYQVYLGVNAGLLLPVVVAVAFIAVFAFVLNLQRMFITSGGFGYHGTEMAGMTWRPDSLRLVCVVFLALLFAQPLLLLLRHTQFESALQERIAAVTSLYRNSQLTRLDRARNDLLKRTAALDEKLQLLGVRPPPDLGTMGDAPSTASSRRKALVIGIQHYRHLATLPAMDTPAEIERTLRSMGYQVTRVSDLGYDNLLVAVDRYLKLLQPGDISVVYYAGYAGARTAPPRLLPADFAQDQPASTIKLSQFMDDLAATSPRASVLLLDNIVLAGEAALPNAAQITPPPNTIVVTALSSRAPREHHSTSSALTKALTHQLGRGQAAEIVLRAVADEVGTATNKASKETQTVSVVSALSKAYVQLSGTVPAAQLSLTDVATELDGNCPREATSSTEAAKTCLLDAKRVLRAQLAEIERQRNDGVERKVGAYRNSVVRSRMVRERWQMLWLNPWANAGLMVICVLAMMLGDLLRDLRPGPLRRYELARAQLARTLVEQTFMRVKDRVAEAFEGFPAGPLPGPRWHELRSYFDRGVATTPVHVAPFEPHGSADDLLDRLAWQPQRTEETP